MRSLHCRQIVLAVTLFACLLKSVMSIRVNSSRASIDHHKSLRSRKATTDEQKNLVNMINSLDATNYGRCNCNNITYLCNCLMMTDDNEWTSHSVDVDIAERVMATLKEQEVLSRRNADHAGISSSNNGQAVLYSGGKSTSDRRTWPPKEPYKYENPKLGELTGKEEPLFHLQTFPASPKAIGTTFILLHQLTLCDKSTKDDKVACRRVTNHTQNYIHYENITRAGKTLDRCDILYVNIHGFRSSQADELYVNLKKNQLDYHKDNVDESLCVLLVDWEEGAASQGVYYYAPAAANVVTVGREVALLTYYLVLMDKVKPVNVHLIGFSLGAQVCHFASLWLRNLTSTETSPTVDTRDWRVGRITGLDPAARDFSSYNGSHLEREDAIFVDVIHTSIVEADGGVRDVLAGRFGMAEAIGSIDFYPNGGTASQPQCSRGPSESCSHNRALVYFTDSLDTSIDRKAFTSVACESYENLSTCEQLFLSNSTSEMSRQGKQRAISAMGITSIQYPGRGVHFLNYLSKKDRLAVTSEMREEEDEYDWDY